MAKKPGVKRNHTCSKMSTVQKFRRKIHEGRARRLAATQIRDIMNSSIDPDDCVMSEPVPVGQNSWHMDD